MREMTDMAAPQNAPGMTIKDRFLYRDYGPQVEENDPADENDDVILPSAGNFFSADINGADTVVRGPSWWLLRDYANLYKRLKTSGNALILWTAAGLFSEQNDQRRNL